MSARVIDTTRRWPCDITVRVTRVPARPLISDAAKVCERLASEVAPTLVIRSPELSPALAAGESGNTSLIISPSGWLPTSIPIPLRWGLSWLWKAW